MYQPPENSNRVRSMRSRFENIDNHNLNSKLISKTEPINKKKSESNEKSSTQSLSRQLSDPSRRNVRRTPAFRIDINSEKSNGFERSSSCNRSFYFERLQQYNTALKNVDAIKKTDSTTDPLQNESTAFKDNQKRQIIENYSKPALIKSKSSLDFTLIRSKFEGIPLDHKSKKIEPTPVKNDKVSINKISCLYAEPMRKPLQSRNFQKVDNFKTETIEIFNDIYNTTIGDEDQQNTTVSKSTCDIVVSEEFTDTLKAALKRPLPSGPAPQKPPRTFEHTPVKNSSFLHCKKQEEKIKTVRSEYKHDPRYMLNKLESALRNNKIKTRKPVKHEVCTTSGDDSDDSVLYKSKSQSKLPPIPKTPSDAQHSVNFNCFNGLTTCNSTYETIPQPNSSFFVSCQPEPVYAEPFNFSQDISNSEAINNFKNEQKSAKSSLYYMSTSLLSADGKSVCLTMDDKSNQVYGDNSSMSSVTSESDGGLALTPVDGNVSIRQIIDNFETGQNTNVSNKNNTCPPTDGFQRIEELKRTLHRTLEKCFDHDFPDEPTTPTTFVDSIVNKFQTYVKTMPKYQRPKLNMDDRLFYCCLVVGWEENRPKIKFRYPRNVKIPDRMEDLCYPEAASGGPLDISDNAQCYSLVITNEKGERTFGYCRRVIPEGSTRCIPLAYCILSKHRAPRFYKKILKELESRHGIPDKLRDELISKFYHNKFPRPGESVKIDMSHFCCDNGQSNLSDLKDFVHVTVSDGDVVEKTETAAGNNNASELRLSLHQDTRYEEADLKELHKLPSHLLLKIFASLLLERKVILISCVISKLSSCVDALQSILYPFSWPHTFIPILPRCLWDVVESPTPVICGILSVSVVNEHKIEDGIVVDLDEGSIISDQGDEDNILCGSMKKAFYQGLALANSIPPDDYVHSFHLNDAYVKVLVVALKHYKSHIVNNTFEKEDFIKNAKSKGIRRFLKWFTESTMFISFIESVINNPDSFSHFDRKIEMYGTEGSNIILTKLWKKM